MSGFPLAFQAVLWLSRLSMWLSMKLVVVWLSRLAPNPRETPVMTANLRLELMTNLLQLRRKAGGAAHPTRFQDSFP